MHGLTVVQKMPYFKERYTREILAKLPFPLYNKTILLQSGWLYLLISFYYNTIPSSYRNVLQIELPKRTVTGPV
jgi:hypothetical protein